ncbi:hypothetical protein AB0B66_34380 [Catellatospora sp. NPDC049111]|uniref:hypothetical protein n=1 Tax=Catellatospora sp. NPDC049111 TaxID=3155271 RepID=UPI0033D6EE72
MSELAEPDDEALREERIRKFQRDMAIAKVLLPLLIPVVVFSVVNLASLGFIGALFFNWLFETDGFTGWWIGIAVTALGGVVTYGKSVVDKAAEIGAGLVLFILVIGVAKSCG